MSNETLERAVACLFCNEEIYSCVDCSPEHLARMRVLAEVDLRAKTGADDG